MPNTSEQPFADQTPRDPRDEKLVGQVLGPDAAADMRELVDQSSEKTEEPLQTMDFSEEEETDFKEAENEICNADQRRKQYYELFSSLGEDWVDGAFIFEDDGRVRVDGNLRLGGEGISELPPGLYEVSGELHLNDNEFTKIPEIPAKVTSLFLGQNRIKKIENLPGNLFGLYMDNNQVERIENLPDGLKCLALDGNKIKTIEGLPKTVDCVYLNNNSIEVIENIPASAYRLELKNNKIASMKGIPENINCSLEGNPCISAAGL